MPSILSRVLFPSLMMIAVSASASRAEVPTSKVSCLTSKCHADLGLKRYIHGPIGSGSCDVCHRVNQWPKDKHPQLLTASGGDKCLSCHDEARGIVGHKYKHTPVAKGECIACHDPHQSSNRFLLIKGALPPEGKVNDLCFECHNKSLPNWTSGFHGAVPLLECTICHDPHSSPNPLQLTRYVKTVLVRDYLALGNEDIEEGRYTDAIQNLSFVLAVDAKEPTALFLVTKAYLGDSQPDKAIIMVNRLLEINPLNPEALYLKALIARYRGDEFQAITLLRQSLSLKAGDAEVLYTLGLILAKRKLYLESLAALNDAAKADPSSKKIHLALADVYDILGRADDAARERGLAK